MFVEYSEGTFIPDMVTVVKAFIFVKRSLFIDLILELSLNEVCLICSLADGVSPGSALDLRNLFWLRWP